MLFRSEDESARAVVRAIVAMGHSLGVTVVAEGVETEEQQHWLVDAGCDLLQGYFDGPPAPPNSEEWRRRHTPYPAVMHAMR